MIIKGRKVMVIGDVILDEFVYGSALGISAETPTVVMKEEHREETYGGAALVARHIANLGGDVTLLTVFNDPIDLPEIDIGGIYGEMKISKKTRYMINGYKMLQVDDLNDIRHDVKSAHTLLDQFDKIIEDKKIEVVVIADNRHGVINSFIASAIISSCRRKNIVSIVDSQISQNDSDRRSWYFGCSCMMLNEREAKRLVIDPENDIDKLSDYFGTINVIVKLGARGSIAHIDGDVYRTFAPVVNVVDTTGAGDAFLSVISMSDMKNPKKDLDDANKWASFMCTIKGTSI